MRSRSVAYLLMLVTAGVLGCSADAPTETAASGAAPTASSAAPTASSAAPTASSAAPTASSAAPTATSSADTAASATSSAAPAALQPYSPAGEGFSALMLTPVSVKTKEDGTKVFSSQRADGSAFTVICPLRQQTLAPGMELLGFKEGVLSGAQIVESRGVVVDNVDGFEVRADKGKGGKRYRLDIRVLGKTRRMCAFVSATPDGVDHHADVRAFLDSARVLE